MRLLRKIARLVAILVVFSGCLGTAFSLLCLWSLENNLPNVKQFINSPSLQTADVFDKNGERIGCIASEWRYSLPMERIIPTRAAEIIVAQEDHRYWIREPRFGGITFILDYYSIIRALYENFTAGHIVKGASTIPQQVAKMMLPARERSQRNIWRKIREVLIARKLWEALDRKQILALYLNEVPLGENTYGVQAGALHYFSKDIENLSVRECALLASMIKAPATFSIRRHPRRAKEELNKTLRRAYQAGAISKEERDAAYMDIDGDEPIPLNDTYDTACHRSPYVARSALDQMRDKLDFYFDNRQQNISWSGIRIYTTVDATLQRYAEEAVTYGIKSYHDRLGEKAINANGAMVVIENTTGHVLAIVGGANYTQNQYNVALNGARQAGSSFKPIVYASYFEKLVTDGIAPEKLLDQPISNAHISCRGATRQQRWNPKNFDEKKFSGSSYPIRKAIAQSINRCALHAASYPQSHCALDPRVIIMARRLGINIFPKISAVDPSVRTMLPIAIGGADIVPLELARAYSVFPNGGVLRTYNIYIVDKITDTNDRTMYQSSKTETQVLDPSIAEVMVEALRGVVTSGTAKSVLGGLPQEISGKTGTTNNYSDAWFCGFTSGITACVWIGSKDKTESLGIKETGGRVAAPAFKYFIEQYYKDSPL